MSLDPPTPRLGDQSLPPDQSPVPAPRLVADRDEIARFVDALFRYASSETYVSLRSFYHDPKRPPADIRAVRLRLDDEGLAPLVRQASARATYTANLASPAVFAPPICTFKTRSSAAESNLAEGLALSVECDGSPAEARPLLQGLLGPATVVVASGGRWIDPATGEAHDKLHLHWRLSELAADSDEHARLKRARRLAARLAGADVSAVPAVHPLRWPGSWHRKAEAKMARIVDLAPKREIHLDEALEVLEDAARLAGLEGLEDGRTTPIGTNRMAADGDLEALAEAIANADLPWDEWNRVGMAFWAASGGSEPGLAAFLRWSAKSRKHDPAQAAARWAHYRTSPPNRLSVATLVHLARLAVPRFRLPSWCDIGAVVAVAARASSSAAGRTQDEAVATPKAEVPPEAQEQEEAAHDSRVQLKLGPAWINDTTRACARLLDGDIYMRGSVAAVLVRVEDLSRASEAQDGEVEPGVLVRGVRHATGSLVFAEPSPERVMYRLDERVLFWRFDKRAEDWVPACCPAAIAKRLIGAAADLDFRPCAGIVAVPLFVDGEIVVTPGYHATTGVFLDLPDRLPAVAAAPTKAEAQTALAMLLRPFRGYFAGRGPADTLRLRCAFAAAALTAVLRPSLPAAPAVLVDANVPGAGKGKAARALAMIATGRLPAIITEGHAEEETEKRLAAAILSGASALLLDNLQRMLASSTLESGLTEGVATIRLFGRLIDVTVPCAALVLITANNAALRADMLRRTLPVRIVADTEQPERRQFAFDPYEEAQRHRLEIVAAGLTIAKAWWTTRDTEHGRPIRQTTLGSFEAWADLVAGAVEWLTGMNPIALIEERKAEDPARGAERRVIAALHQLFGERPWTAKEAVGKPGELGREATGLDPDAWAAVMAFKGDRPTAHQVGIWLRKRKDKVFGELQLLSQVGRDDIVRWQVRGMRGIAGDTPSQPQKVGSRGDEFTPVNRHACGDDKSIRAGGTIPRNPPHPPQPAPEFDL